MYLVIDCEGYCGDVTTVHETTDSEKVAWSLNKRGGMSRRVMQTESGHTAGDRIPMAVVRDMISCGRWSQI